MHKILVFPSGTELGLEIHDALYRRRDLLIVGAESIENSHAKYVFKDNFMIPHVDSDDFVKQLNALLFKENIDFIYPAHDTAQLALLTKAHDIKCPIISSSIETVSVSRYKSKTYQALGHYLPVPNVFCIDNVQDRHFPVFVKPDCGQGSQNAFRCDDRISLMSAMHKAHDMLICEYLPGEEITVDCFSDRDTGLLFCNARKRKRIRAGISVSSEAVVCECAYDYSIIINRLLQPFGAWFFQLKEKNNSWILLEVGARIPGGATYQRMRGVNLPLLTLFEHERKKVTILENNSSITMDRAFISRFRLKIDISYLYIDFDDCLCLNTKPNLEIIDLIIAAKANKIPVYLLSRNNGDCKLWLQSLGIFGIFDEIILLDRAAPKSSSIKPGGILVDDSFQERQECTLQGIPSFDVDAAPMLTATIIRSYQ